MTYQEVFATIKSWPLEAQYQLLDELYALLVPDIEPEPLAEIERRSDLYDQGKMTAAPWSEVRDRVRREVGLDPTVDNL